MIINKNHKKDFRLKNFNFSLLLIKKSFIINLNKKEKLTVIGTNNKLSLKKCMINSRRNSTNNKIELIFEYNFSKFKDFKKLVCMMETLIFITIAKLSAAKYFNESVYSKK